MKLNKYFLGFLLPFFLTVNSMQQLKDSLSELKGKLGDLHSKLTDLNSKLQPPPQPEAIKNFNDINGITCNCEFWKVTTLRKWVAINCQGKKIGTNASFNVIKRSKDYPRDPKDSEVESYTENSVDDAISAAQNGTVFQLAANDSIAYTWANGGSHAGYLVTNTEFGNAIREHVVYRNLIELDTLFAYNSAPTCSNYRAGYGIANGTVCLNTFENADNLDNIHIAIFSNLATAKDKAKSINVVLTAAYPGGRKGAIAKYGQSKGLQIALNCLKAGYDGILLSAIKLGKPNVVLTFIGGHAFGGTPGDAITAIENATREFVTQYNLNVTVYLDDAFLGNTVEEQQQSDARLKALAREIEGKQRKQINFDGNNYGVSEYWNVIELEKYINDNNFIPFPRKAAFNLFKRGELGDEQTAYNKLVGDPNYNRAVFQVAANDNVSGMWNWGGYQAGYFIDSTTLGNITRTKADTFMDSFFSGSPLSNGHVTLCTTGDKPLDINKIYINVHSDLEVKNNLLQDKSKKQIIHASITAGYSGGRERAKTVFPEEPKKAEALVLNCLQAGYEGTLLAAILLRTPNVVLTFLGCHLFGGLLKDAANEIEKAVEKYKKYNLNVTVYMDDSGEDVYTTDAGYADNLFLNLRRKINGNDSNIEPQPPAE